MIDSTNSVHLLYLMRIALKVQSTLLQRESSGSQLNLTQADQMRCLGLGGSYRQGQSNYTHLDELTPPTVIIIMVAVPPQEMSYTLLA